MAGLVRGIFDAMVELESQSAKQTVAKQMGDFYGIPESDTLTMLADAYSTNFADNRDFFLNQNSPTNFERTFNTARMLYRKAGVVDSKVTFDQIVDFSILQKLSKEAKYANQVSNYRPNFAPLSASAIQGESAEILTKTVVIQFFPNSFDLARKVTKLVNGQTVSEDYDPNIPAVLEEVGRLAGQYGAARIVIEGHTDASMRNMVPETAVQELSMNRANAVKQALVAKFSNLDPNQFAVSGMGWSRAADASDPENHQKNRRVEIKVYPLEQQ
jgi:outer membrane protein OmpA-like peptidoglycan-associated protein